MLKVPDDPVAELEPLLLEHGVEHGIQWDDRALVHEVADLPAQVSVLVQHTDTLPML